MDLIKDLRKTQEPDIKTASTPKRFHPSQYMLCVIQEHGYRRVFSPDFEFHFTVPSNDDPHRWTAVTLHQAEKEIELRLNKLTLEGKDHPAPKKWRTQLLGGSDKKMSIREAAALLGISESTVRRLADDGQLPSTHTRKGHRRFSVGAIQDYMQAQTRHD